MIWLFAAAYAETIPVTGKPVEVTVYRSQARVTRRVNVTVGNGRQEIVFDGLPTGMRPETVSAELAGNGILRGVDVRQIPAAEAADERIRGTRTKLDAIALTRQAADDRATAARRRLDAIAQSRSEAAEALSRQLLVGKGGPAQLNALGSTMSADEAQARDALRVAEGERASYDQQIAAFQRELQTLGQGGSDTWRAIVQVDSRAGTIGVDLTYLVEGASWTPRYDVRGDADAAKVEIALSARVAQTTGEDWSAVKLTVSSAVPSLGTEVPVLAPFWLERPRPVYAPKASARRADASAPVMAEMAMDEDMEAPGAPAPPMEVARAEVDLQLSATAFSVPRSTDIPSDGLERQVLLTIETMDAVVRWVVVPRLDTRVYVVGEVENTASFPLLPGTAGTFLGSAYLGDFELPSVAPGEKFDVAFGIDERVTVVRAPRKVETSEASLVGKRRTSSWTWDIKAKNAHKRSIPLTVIEQIPITSRTDTKVELLKSTVPPKKDEEGRLELVVPLPPGQTTTLTWGYHVEYPADLSFGWLE